MSLRLVIANKNYSSWSMRPWVALHAARIPFEEVKLDLAAPHWEARDKGLTPAGRVPVLWIDGHAVWDSLAILETIAELHPEAALWPEDRRDRMHARALAAEMHSGFAELRKHMPMNIRASLPGRGMTDAVRRDIDRICAAWSECLAKGGPFLFGELGNVDAMFAPVALRFATYGVQLPEPAARYAAALRQHRSVRAWIEDALTETSVLPEDEPYAGAP